MNSFAQNKPSSSSGSNSYSPQPITQQQRTTRDSGLCKTQDIPDIPAFCIDNLNSHRLGNGTYGFVEKTKYRKSKNQEYKPAAIKYAYQSHLTDLIREAKTMWELRDHSNIIKIYGFYKCSRHGRGVVMEYMDCGSMDNLVYKQKSLDYTIDNVASWLFQLANAVHFFHASNKLHRDLKLQNILLCDRYRTLKLCDFGTFTAMHQSMTSNRGTPITMAPEVFRCENYDMKSDIYSIGIIMWQLIARNHPYSPNFTVLGLLFNVTHNNLRPPELECNPILSGFYKRCWHQDAHMRPTSAECVEYFSLLKSEFPLGNVPLSNNSTNGPAETPPPRAFLLSGSESASFSKLGMNGGTPSEMNNLNIPQAAKSHRRNRSETIMIKQNPPYPVTPGEASSSNAFREQRSQSEVKSTRNVGERQPHRPAPPLPASSVVRSRTEINDAETSLIFQKICTDEDTRPIDPDMRDEQSLSIFHQHCHYNKQLATAFALKREALASKHALLAQWRQHDHHVELLARQNYLEQEIAKLEGCSDEEDSSPVIERM